MLVGKEVAVLRRKHDGQRNVRISDLTVSWKWPVSKVVSHDHRWTTQYQLQWPRNNTYREEFAFTKIAKA